MFKTTSTEPILNRYIAGLKKMRIIEIRDNMKGVIFLETEL